MLQAVPLGCMGTPDEVAHAIRWLVGPEAPCVTGAILDVASGF